VSAPKEVWTETLPTAAGRYLWRKNYQWEPIERDVYFSEVRGCLVCWSSRYEQAVPLIQLYGEWLVPPATDLPVKNGVFAN
jgi:hypothetical protein